MDALYAPARFHDHDLDARSQLVGKSKTSALHALGTSTSDKHYTGYNGRVFLRDLDFANVCMVVHFFLFGVHFD